MPYLLHKYTLGALVLLVIIGAGIIFFLPEEEPLPVVVEEPVVEEIIEEPEPFLIQEVIGQSVEGRDIESYRFGNGENHLFFVGGIHGGYEWNSIVLAYDFIDYFTEDKSRIPENITVSIIPNLNPDGLYKVTGLENQKIELEDIAIKVDSAQGRFNSNDVDLNRNFDCKWAPESSWRGQVVSAGTEAFSEPEAVALRDYVLAHNPKMAVFWHSKASAVFASECEQGVLRETLTIMDLYAEAAGYRAIAVFDAYPVTGDVEGWLASINIPAITVELTTHETIEWEENLAAVTSLLEYYENTPE